MKIDARDETPASDFAFVTAADLAGALFAVCEAVFGSDLGAGAIVVARPMVGLALDRTADATVAGLAAALGVVVDGAAGEAAVSLAVAPLGLASDLKAGAGVAALALALDGSAGAEVAVLSEATRAVGFESTTGAAVAEATLDFEAVASAGVTCAVPAGAELTETTLAFEADLMAGVTTAAFSAPWPASAASLASPFAGAALAETAYVFVPDLNAGAAAAARVETAVVFGSVSDIEALAAATGAFGLESAAARDTFAATAPLAFGLATTAPFAFALTATDRAAPEAAVELPVDAAVCAFPFVGAATAAGAAWAFASAGLLPELPVASSALAAAASNGLHEDAPLSGVAPDRAGRASATARNVFIWKSRKPSEGSFCSCVRSGVCVCAVPAAPENAPAAEASAEDSGAAAFAFALWPSAFASSFSLAEPVGVGAPEGEARLASAASSVCNAARGDALGAAAGAAASASDLSVLSPRCDETLGSMSPSSEENAFSLDEGDAGVALGADVAAMDARVDKARALKARAPCR